MDKYFHKAVLPVVDRHGTLLRTQTIYNTPMPYLFPEQDMPVIIDWRGGEANPKRPTEKEFLAGVEYNGKRYIPYYWGSGIKMWRTLAFTRDFLRDEGMIEKAEQAVYGARYLLASNGGFYGATVGRFRVAILPPDTTIPGTNIVVADGHGAIRRDRIYLNQHPPIQLGRMRPSYQLAQWIDVNKRKVWKEVRELIDRTFLQAVDPETFDPVQFALKQGYLSPDKERLASLHPDMLLHPMVASTAAKATQDLWFRLATSIPFKAENRLLVPITGHTMVWPGHEGPVLAYRFPLDGPVVQALEVRRDPELEAYLNNLEVVQVSVCARNFFSKGLLSLVDSFGPMYDDCDILVCSKDIKMANPASFDVENIDQVKQLGMVEIDGGVFALQRFGRGSCIGIDAKWAADAIGADVDGDQMGVVDANELPAIWQAVRDLKKIPTKKVPKTSNPLDKKDRRPELAVTNMRNIVGMASNELTSAMSIGNIERVAQDLNYRDATTLLTELNHCIKYGTDGFKSLLDMDRTEKILLTFGGHFVNKYGCKPPWLKWRRSDKAFVTQVPKVGWKDSWSDEEKELSLPSVFKGTIARIARYTLPAIEKVFQRRVRVKPLSYYKSWAQEQPLLTAFAKDMQFWFNKAMRDIGVGIEDGKTVQAFKQLCQQHAADFCAEKKIDPYALACELWNVAHSKDGTAASVFYLFPLESEKIIVEHGLAKKKQTIRTKVVGLHYQVLNPPVRMELDVEVVEYVKQVKDREVVQTVICGKVPHQVQPKPGYPQDMLAVVESKSLQPPVGRYHARLTRCEGSAYTAELCPLA